MDELIEEMRARGLISFRMVGKAKAVFSLLELLANTEPMEDNTDWWAIRAWLLGTSRDTQFPGDLQLRRN